MKRLLFLIILVLGFSTANAQTSGFNLGANYIYDGGGPGVTVDANYLFEISDEFRIGPVLSYQYFFAKSIEISSGINLDIDGGGGLIGAVGARYDVLKKIVLGADLGYRLSNGSSFYYRPLVGYMLSEKSMIQLSLPSSYGSRSNGIGLGIMIGL